MSFVHVYTIAHHIFLNIGLYYCIFSVEDWVASWGVM